MSTPPLIMHPEPIDYIQKIEEEGKLPHLTTHQEVIDYVREKIEEREKEFFLKKEEAPSHFIIQYFDSSQKDFQGTLRKFTLFFPLELVSDFTFLSTDNYICVQSKLNIIKMESIEYVLKEIYKEDPPFWDRGIEKRLVGYLAASQYFYQKKLDSKGKKDLIDYIKMTKILR